MTKFKKDFLHGKNILLLGGAGFIGHNLAIRLRELGANVTVADSFDVNNMLNVAIQNDETADLTIYKDFLSERIELLKQMGVTLKITNSSDLYSLSKTLADNYDTVYLLAAVSHASRSNKDPVNAINNGLTPLTNLITLLADTPSTRMVYLSSSTVYGNFEKAEVDESDICRPFGMYAVLKHLGENLLKETAEYSKLNFSAIRPSALYGERCISRRVSQIFLENAFAGRTLKFNGDPSEKLDFTYIRDLVDGLVLAGHHQNAKGEIFNITFGNARPILNLVDILREKFKNVKVEISERSQATPIRGTLLNSKARNLLGFEPIWNLETGYRKYIEWYIERSKSEVMIFNDHAQHNE